MIKNLKKVLCLMLSLSLIASFMIAVPILTSADTTVVESAISWAERIANDNSHLYSQKVRWGPSYDCSSFVISAFKNAGVDTGSASYTGNMRSQFTQHGFTWIPWSQIGGVGNLVRGDILLNEVNHTELYLGNSKMVGAHSSKYAAADQISVVGYSNNSNWDGVLRYTGGDCGCSTSYAGQYIINTTQAPLTLRSGHGTGYSAITTIPKGTVVTVTKANGSWAHVEWNGLSGYCSMEYLKKVDTGNDPIQCLDNIGAVVGGISLHGWAFDKDDINASLQIHVYIGDEGHVITADKEGSDVNNVYGCGTNHRFSDTIFTSLSGNQEVKVYAINVGGGGNVLMRHVTVNIPPDTEKPHIKGGYISEVKRDSFRVCVEAEDNCAVERVMIATWTDPEQKDLIWRRANYNGYGTWFVDVNRSEHAEKSNYYYINHAYVYDYAGNASCIALDKDYTYKSTTGKNIPEGEYRIVAAADQTKGIDVAGANSANDTNIQLYSNTNDKKQIFEIKYAGDGFYKIINTYTKKSIDVWGGTYVNGTNILLYEEHSGVNQQWAIEKNADGTYTIISRANGMAVDIAGAKMADGTNIQAHERNDSSAQKFLLKRVIKTSMVTREKDKGNTTDIDTIKKSISVVVDNKKLTMDKDYTVDVSIENLIATYTVTGINEYTGKEMFTYAIEKNENEEYINKNITFSPVEYTYDGKTKTVAINGNLPTGVSVKYENNGKVNVGKYEVKASFIDDSNGKEITSMTTTLSILKAENSWKQTLTCKNVTYGNAPQPYANAEFGTVKYLYSLYDTLTFSSTVPTEPGTYWVEAKVYGTNNYNELNSNIVKFEILPKETTTKTTETTVKETTKVPETTTVKETTTNAPETTTVKETTTKAPETTTVKETTTNAPETTTKAPELDTEETTEKPKKISLSECEIYGIEDKIYTGEPIEQDISVYYEGDEISVDVTYYNNVNVGTATVVIKGTGNFKGSTIKKFRITKDTRDFDAYTDTEYVDYTALKKKNIKLYAPIMIDCDEYDEDEDVITYKNLSTGLSSRFKINKDTGVVTVRKGTKKGTYKLRIKVTLKGNDRYKTVSEKVTLKIKVV